MKALAVFLSVSVMLLRSEGCRRQEERPPDVKYSADTAGTYVFAITIDPVDWQDVEMEIWSKDRNKKFVTGMARKNIITALDVALPLMRGENLSMTSNIKQGNAHSFTAVWTNRDYSFVTAQCNGYSGGRGIVPFHSLIDPWRGPQPTATPQTSFRVPRTGIYWVTMRADCEKYRAAVMGLSLNFYTICNEDHAIAESGAIFWEQNKTVQVRYIDGNSKLESMTMFSFTLLEGNRVYYTRYTKQGDQVIGNKTRSYMAYTAFSEANKLRHIQFSHFPVVNYGNLWKERHHIFYRFYNNRPRRIGLFQGIVTQIKGIYLISTAGRNFRENQGFHFQLNDVNIATSKRTKLHTFYHERGLRTGQTRAFSLGVQALEIIRSDGSTFGNNNKLSVALVYHLK